METESNTDSIEKHLKVEHSIPCETCIPNSAVKLSSPEMRKEQGFTCDVCKVNFVSKMHLDSHVSCPAVLKPFTCGNCEKSFRSRANLKLHIRIHTGDKPFVCSYCQKAFRQKHCLRVHIREHTGEKPYVCSTCGKGFSQNCTLKRHLKIHKGVKPYMCTICGKSFLQKSNYKRHVNSLKKMSSLNNRSGKNIENDMNYCPGNKSKSAYICQHCNKRYSSKQSLNNHLRLQSGNKTVIRNSKGVNPASDSDSKQGLPAKEKTLSCSLCMKQFRKKWNLDAHLSSHIKEKPFECAICLKTYAYKSSLKTHLLTHTGEKPFSCDVCNESFKLRSTFKKHLRKHNME